jgi:hypothetical protein
MWPAQIYPMKGILGVKTPPIKGLAEEEVKVRSTLGNRFPSGT